MKKIIKSQLVLATVTEVVRRAITKTSSGSLSRVVEGKSLELSAEGLATQAIRSTAGGKLK